MHNERRIVLLCPGLNRDFIKLRLSVFKSRVPKNVNAWIKDLNYLNT